MPSLSFRVRTSRTDAQGYAPLHLRLIHDRTVRRISLQVRIRAAHWHAPKERVRGAHPDAARVNQYLARTMSRAQEVITRYSVGPGLPAGAAGASALRDAIQARLANRSAAASPDAAARTDFLAYAWEEVDAYRRRGQVSTYKRYKADIGKLEAWWDGYANGPEGGSASVALTFEGLTVERLEAFRTWMYEERGNAGSTVGKTLKAVRTFVNKARRAGHMHHYPFEHMTMDSSRPVKEKLTPGEMKRLERHLWEKEEMGTLRWRILSYFLFSYYGGGMRYSDVMTLQRRHIDAGPKHGASPTGRTSPAGGGSALGRIAWRMQKTGADVVGVPIVPEALRILSVHAGTDLSAPGALAAWVDAAPERWVFPIADTYGLDETSTERAIELCRSSRNAMANTYLKRIARDAGVNEGLSFHMARHSAAWQMYTAIGDIYKVSKLLGHSSVQQTERYLEGFADDSLDDAFRNAF